MKLSNVSSLFFLIGMPICACSEANEALHVCSAVPGLLRIITLK